jgi:hypothetical protein
LSMTSTTVPVDRARCRVTTFTAPLRARPRMPAHARARPWPAALRRAPRRSPALHRRRPGCAGVCWGVLRLPALGVAGPDVAREPPMARPAIQDHSWQLVPCSQPRAVLAVAKALVWSGLVWSPVPGRGVPGGTMP